MRRPFVAGNWKMNKTVEEARLLITEMSSPLQAIKGVEKVVCPPYMALLSVAALLQGTEIGLGAQNMHWEEKGAYTGEISPKMISEFCQYVIIGHSERRANFGETNENVNRKIKAAQASDLTPIVCVGETLSEYEAGKTAEVVKHQIHEGLADLRQEFMLKIVIAYEPVWAIGTGRASTGENANAVVGSTIRLAIAELYGDESANSLRVLYGGSVTPANANEFFQQPEIDGALVGGASLKAGDFVAITRAAAAGLA